MELIIWFFYQNIDKIGSLRKGIGLEPLSVSI